jgi:hypothetical protein
MTMDKAPAKSAPTLSSRVRVNESVLFQELQGEAVLLHLDSGMYFGLDPVGTRMWQLIAEHERLADVAGAIVAEFEVSDDQCAIDLLALVEKLEDRGLVTVAG